MRAQRAYRLVRELLFDVPPGWEVQVAEEGEAENCPFFHNVRTDESQWEHPMQQAHKRRIEELLRSTSGSPSRQRREADKQEHGARAGERTRKPVNLPAHDVLELEEFDDVDVIDDDNSGNKDARDSPTPSWRPQSSNDRSPPQQASGTSVRKTVRWEDLSSTQSAKELRQRADSPTAAVPDSGVRSVARLDPGASDEDSVAALKVRVVVPIPAVVFGVRTDALMPLAIPCLQAQLQRARTELEEERKRRVAAESSKATEALAAKQQAEKAFEAQLRILKDAHQVRSNTCQIITCDIVRRS